MVVLGDVDLLLDFVKLVHGDVAGLLEAVSDLQRVDTLVEELLGLLEDGAGEHDDSGGSISDFVVLRCGQLDQQLGGLVMNLDGNVKGGLVLTSIFSRMVAPSLVMMTSPSGETSILSMPLGPRDVFRRLATVLAAKMLI